MSRFVVQSLLFHLCVILLASATDAEGESVALKIGGLRIDRDDLIAELEVRRSRGQNSLREYLLERLVVGKALAEGFGQRREISEMVDLMERHMLSDAESPLVEKLSDLEPKEGVLMEEAARVYSVLRCVFPRRTLLSLRPSDRELKTGSWLRPRPTTPGARFLAYHLSYPYGEYEGLIASLRVEDADHGSQIELDGFSSVQLMNDVSSATTAEELAGRRAAVRHRSLQKAYQLYRRSQLDHADLRVDREEIGKLERRLRVGTIFGTDEPDAILADYRDGSRRVTVSASQWLQYYSRLIAKPRPRETDVAGSIAEMIVAQCMIADSRKLGLERLRSFQQGRERFRHAQLIDLFERERIAPLIHSEWHEITREFEKRRCEFRRTVWIGGRVFYLASYDAQSVMNALMAQKGLPLLGVDRVELFSVGLSEFGDEFRYFIDVLGTDTRLPAYFGPSLSRSGERYILEVRERRIRNELTAEVAEELRQDLLARRVKEYETAHAKTWAAELGVACEKLLADGTLDAAEMPW